MHLHRHCGKLNRSMHTSQHGATILWRGVRDGLAARVRVRACEEAGGALGHRGDSGVELARDERGQHRRVSDAQPVDAAHAKARIDGRNVNSSHWCLPLASSR